MKYCPYCGSTLFDDAAFCPKCGKEFKSYSNTEEAIKTADVSVAKESFESKPINNKKHNIQILLTFAVILVALLIVGISLLLNRNFIKDSKKIAAVTESVVMVYTYDNQDNLLSTGSGFLVYDDSTVVTNNHVTEDAYRISISTEQDHTYEIANIISFDASADIVLLKTIKPTGLKPLGLGSSDKLMKGEDVLAIGSPEGLKNTVSTGVLSGRIFNPENGLDILQITAPISHGSSGGALFNKKGEVVGITFAGYDEGQNLNFAIPIEVVENVYTSEISNISILEYLSFVNPLQKLYYDHYDCYVETKALIDNPEKYSGGICCLIYLFNTGHGYLAYKSEDNIFIDDDYIVTDYGYYYINNLNCIFLGSDFRSEIDPSTLDIPSGVGAYALIYGYIHNYYDTSPIYRHEGKMMMTIFRGEECLSIIRIKELELV